MKKRVFSINSVDVPRMAEEQGISAAIIGFALFNSKKDEDIQYGDLWCARKACQESWRGSKKRRSALIQWRRFSLIQIREADNLNKALDAYKNTPSGTKEEILAEKKVLQFCFSCDDFEKVYSRPGGENTRLSRLSMAGWKKCSLDEARKADNFQQALDALSKSPSGSRGEMMALRKCLRFCSSISEAREILDYTARGTIAQEETIHFIAAKFYRKK